ncbi:MAG TPA: hypothetical protein VHU18_13130 [Rhizomicrobium sp.]|nr:hypothetical protein [Rhizomicrobium sp.]
MRFFAPEQSKIEGTWCCCVQIDAPFEITKTVFGESSLQALILAIKLAGSYLYGSELYKNGQLGLYGEFGRDLLIPAPKEFLDIAPYPL